MKIDITITTGGDGSWSVAKKNVRCTAIHLNYQSDDLTFGEALVEFDTTTWDTNTDGIIYTDKTFLDGLKKFLVSQGMPDDIEYSEQGLQGDDYVSLDCGPALTKYLSGKETN